MDLHDLVSLTRRKYFQEFGLQVYRKYLGQLWAKLCQAQQRPELVKYQTPNEKKGNKKIVFFLNFANCFKLLLRATQVSSLISLPNPSLLCLYDADQLGKEIFM